MYIVITIIISLIIVTILFFNKTTHFSDTLPPTVTEDQRLPKIIIRGAALHSEAFGEPEDPILLFLHDGPFSDYKNVLYLRSLAQERVRVVLYDQRGCGLSQRSEKWHYAIDEHVEDLHAIITYYKKYKEQKVILFGHGLGGALATAYINRFRENIAGAVFAEPDGFTPDLFKSYGERSGRLSLIRTFLKSQQIQIGLPTTSAEQHAMDDQRLKSFLEKEIKIPRSHEHDRQLRLWRPGAIAINGLMTLADKNAYHITDNLSGFNPRVLFLFDAGNRSYGIQFALQEAAFFRNYQLLQISHSGREFIYDKRDEILIALKGYLNTI